MRADRLVSIILALQRHGPRTTRQLAEMLEVSQRTISRDITALGTAGVPVYSERGVKGGFRLMEGYRVDLSGLRSPEIQALFLKRQDRALTDLKWNQEAQIAQEKIRQSLTWEQQNITLKMTERLYIDETPWFSPPAPTLPLRTMYDAVWHQLRLELLYAKPNGTVVHRSVGPYALVAKVGVWYLIGEHEDQIHVYRVSRIIKATTRNEEFLRLPDFNLRQFWEDWTQEFEASRPQYPVILSIANTMHGQLRESAPWLKAGTRVDAANEEKTYRTIRVVFETLESACQNLLGLGVPIRVLDPLELRQELARRAYDLFYVHNQ